jgi:ketosteroid isomerase-like protein
VHVRLVPKELVLSQANVEIVRRFIARINDGEIDLALADITPDAELDWSQSDAPDGGVYRGRQAWAAWIGGRQEGLEGARFDPVEVVDVPPDTVLVVAHMRGRGPASGMEIAALAAGVWTLKDGRVSRLRVFQTREQALDALGLQ